MCQGYSFPAASDTEATPHWATTQRLALLLFRSFYFHKIDSMVPVLDQRVAHLKLDTSSYKFGRMH